MVKRLVFDIDGLLADFPPAYQRVIIATSGRDLFLPGDGENPPCWEWDKLRGYTAEERKAAWDAIKADPDFSFNLNPMETMRVLAHEYDALAAQHEVYFVTSRVGLKVKKQSEDWLQYHLGLHTHPTVVIVGHRVKGLVAKALNADAFIDDNYDNVLDVVRQSPTTRAYLFDRSYNRIPSVGEYAINTTGMSEQDIVSSQRMFEAAHDDHVETVESRRVQTLTEFLRAESLIS